MPLIEEQCLYATLDDDAAPYHPIRSPAPGLAAAPAITEIRDRFPPLRESLDPGLCVGKEYGPAPAYRRDPLNNLSQGATALQTAHFYYLL